jgi:hypothetical protein
MVSRFLIIALSAGSISACATTAGSGVGPAFRHPALRSAAADGATSSAGSARLALAAPVTDLEQRCIRGFRHPGLNRCQRWLPADGAALPAFDDGCSSEAPHCRLALADQARRLMRQPRWRIGGRRFSRDCSGFVMAALAAAGVDLEGLLPERHSGEGGVSLLYRAAERRGRLHHHKVPRIGDLVFFDDTYDRDGDGRADDPLTHVGLVERVDADGTVTFVHHVRRGILRYKLNLFHPEQRRDPTSRKVHNHHLRLGAAGGERRLTGELFHAFATIIH